VVCLKRPHLLGRAAWACSLSHIPTLNHAEIGAEDSCVTTPLEQPNDDFTRQLAAVRANAPLVWDQLAKAHIELRLACERRARRRELALLSAAIVLGCALGVVLFALFLSGR
jgi:hypothetical protein